jgi:hypothetical protein
MVILLEKYVNLYIPDILLECEMFHTDLWKKSKHILWSIFLSENRAVYGTMWKNIVQPREPHVRI